MYNILVVDDDYSYFEIIRDSKIPNMNISYAQDLSAMKEVLKEKAVNLILMDWDLGREDGVDITKDLKSDSATSSIPIVMCTGQMLTEKMVFALNQGADDYVNKPFSVDLLVAKINSNLRKYGTQNKVTCFKHVALDANTFTVSIKGITHQLPKKEYMILSTLISNPQKTFTREELNQLECPGYTVGTRTVDVLINRIREKFDQALGYELIHTFYKKGYKINKNIF